MSHTTHKASIDERFLLKRHLKLNPVSAESAESAENELNAIIGIDSAHICAEKSHLDIAYDGSYKNLDDVEAILLKHDITVANTRWNKIKESWYKNTDENVKENAHHVAHCCNKMPPGKG